MSRFEFKLPDIGEGVTEGEIVSWVVSVGDAVAENQDMVEVMTDKATVTIGAPKSGKVLEILGKEGDVVPVGAVLVVLDVGAEGEAGDKPRAQESGSGPSASAVGDLKEQLPGMKAPSEPAPVRRPTPTLAPRPPETGSAAQPQPAKGGREVASAKSNGGYTNDKPLAAPATRKLARELGVDLRRVQPSGPGGRVTREDVERHQSGGAPEEERAPAPEKEAAPRAAAPRVAPPPPAPLPAAEGEQRVPIRGLRKRIYENMARSKHTAAHFTYVEECEATALKAARERAKQFAADQGVSLTFLPYIVKAVVAALRRHPSLNCLVDDASQEIVLKNSFDIGIAAATDAGLIVPVLRGADRLSILDIAREIDRLGSDARAGKTRREDLGGSSFTITSLGKAGGLFATPVVNYPEVAILGVHEMKRKPVVRGDEIVIGHVMLLSLSFDHRIIDGHVGAAFAQDVIGYLQEPERLFVELR